MDYIQADKIPDRAITPRRVPVILYSISMRVWRKLTFVVHYNYLSRDYIVRTRKEIFLRRVYLFFI